MFKFISCSIGKKFFISFIITLGIVIPSYANNRIAAVVNQEVISAYDLDQRIRISLMINGIKASADMIERYKHDVLQTMIDEAIKTQAAKKNGMEVTSEELTLALEEFAKQQNISYEAFKQKLTQAGMDSALFEKKVKADLAWRKLAAERARAFVGQEEIQAYKSRFEQNKGEREVRWAEIHLNKTPDEPGESVLKKAKDLTQAIRSGKRFSEIARQYSAGPSASYGGDMGWALIKELNPKLVTAIQPLKIGETTEPFETDTGYKIVMLLDDRILGQANERDKMMQVLQVTFPKQSSHETIGRSYETLRKAKGCSTMVATVKSMSSAKLEDVKNVRLGDLAPTMQDFLNKLAIGEISKPMMFPEGIAMLMVCDKKSAESEVLTDDMVRKRLVSYKREKEVNKLMQELRQKSYIEIKNP